MWRAGIWRFGLRVTYHQMRCGRYQEIKPSSIHHATSWWRHQTELFSTLLALCEGNQPVTGGFTLLALCGESIGERWLPSQKASKATFTHARGGCGAEAGGFWHSRSATAGMFTHTRSERGADAGGSAISWGQWWFGACGFEVDAANWVLDPFLAERFLLPLRLRSATAHVWTHVMICVEANFPPASARARPRMCERTFTRKMFPCRDIIMNIPPVFPLQWRHNNIDGVSNHRRLHRLLKPFVEVQIKENIKAPRHSSFVGGIHRDRWIPTTKGQ